MAELTGFRPRVKDLNEQINWRMMEKAYNDGMSLERFLELEDPTSDWSADDDEGKLTAFERQLAFMNIATNDDPESGAYADQFRAFEDHGEAGRVLQAEWMAHHYRKVSQSTRKGGGRSILTSDWGTLGSALRPYVEAAQLRTEEIVPAIPLNELVAFTTPIDSNAYRALYLNDTTADNYRMVRVGEAAEIPGSTLTAGERPVDLYKYGRRLDVSYEILRRAPIPVVAFFIARLAVQAEVDKVSTVIDVLVNGDGNAGTAATVVPLIELDPAATVANVLTLKAWLAFKLKFRNPYTLTTELVREDVLLQQMLLNTGSANVPLLMIQGTGFGGFTPINPALADNVRYGISDEAPANKILAFDRQFAIERVTEIGANINETQRWIKNQTEIMTFTEVEGYAVIDSKAAKILDLTDVTP
jgi:hypothetical protein